MSYGINKGFFSLSALLLCASLLFSYLQKPLFKAEDVEAKTSFTVVIDAGHGGIDAGAIGVNGVLEKELNMIFAETLADIFKENGVDVVFTRTTDALVLKAGEENAPSKKACDLKNRAEIANGIENALLVSIHMNSFPEARYRGFEVYYSANDPESRLYAERIQSTVKEKYEPESRRQAKSGDNIYLLSHSENPAVLIEFGFISNPTDAQKLSDKDYQKKLCFSVFCAIMEVKNK